MILHFIELSYLRNRVLPLKFSGASQAPRGNTPMYLFDKHFSTISSFLQIFITFLSPTCKQMEIGVSVSFFSYAPSNYQWPDHLYNINQPLEIMQNPMSSKAPSLADITIILIKS